jgi:hypothetical protein
MPVSSKVPAGWTKKILVQRAALKAVWAAEVPFYEMLGIKPR